MAAAEPQTRHPTSAIPHLEATGEWLCCDRAKAPRDINELCRARCRFASRTAPEDAEPGVDPGWAANMEHTRRYGGLSLGNEAIGETVEMPRIVATEFMHARTL